MNLERLMEAVEKLPNEKARFLVGLITTTIGLIDYVTGTDVRLFILYFLPLSIIGWRNSKNPSFGSSLLCTGTWVVANIQRAVATQSSVVISWNILSMFTAFYVVGSLFSRMRAYVEELRNAASRDILTSLLNRRGFMAALAREAARKPSKKKPAVLMFIDLDEFKSVNDTYGHDVGDQVLCAVARVLESNLRSSDVSGRLGGDEFAVLLTDTDEAAGAIVANNLMNALRNAGPSSHSNIQCSVGAAAFNKFPSTPLDALRTADELMYEVKKSGKGAFLIKPFKQGNP